MPTEFIRAPALLSEKPPSCISVEPFRPRRVFYVSVAVFYLAVLDRDRRRVVDAE